MMSVGLGRRGNTSRLGQFLVYGAAAGVVWYRRNFIQCIPVAVFYFPKKLLFSHASRYCSGSENGRIVLQLVDVKDINLATQVKLVAIYIGLAA